MLLPADAGERLLTCHEDGNLPKEEEWTAGAAACLPPGLVRETWEKREDDAASAVTAADALVGVVDACPARGEKGAARCGSASRRSAREGKKRIFGSAITSRS